MTGRVDEAPKNSSKVGTNVANENRAPSSRLGLALGLQATSSRLVGG